MSEENINVYIGNKIRSLRLILGMNQTDLGKKMGVTFQQVQKYEKGYNKIVASKLFDLSTKINVPINYFFEGFNEKKELQPNPVFAVHEDAIEFVYKPPTETSARDAIALVKIYNNIPDKSTRKKLLLFLKTLTKE